MSNIQSLHHASVLVSDTARALHFYHDLLGLPIDDSRPVMDFPGAWLWAGNGQIHLLELPERLAGMRPGGHGGRDWHIALEVNDLEAIKQALEHDRIACTVSRSGRRALFCRDPDGNAIELIELQTG